MSIVSRYCLVFLVVLVCYIPLDNIYAQIPVIYDTDIGPDWDDVGATATLHALANSGEAVILAMGVSSGGHSAIWGPPCLDAFNTYYGRPDIPIGVALGGPDFGSSYNQQIAEEFPQDLGTNNAWDAVELYRKILSEQADSSVVIITVGFITNIDDLLKSEPDGYSSLNGMDLVIKKVARWVCMGGGFPSSGGEFNFNRDPDATVFAVENWPKPVLFSGYEIGVSIHTGAKLALTSESNPIRRAYELAGGYVGSTRSSWDQTAVLAAIRDPQLYWNLETTGYCSVAANGSNLWYSSPDSDHSYLISNVPDAEMTEIIDNMMANVHGLPEVSITSPTNGASFDEGDNISIETVVSDSDGQVIRVEFYARAEKIGQATGSPFNFVWNNVQSGGYYLTAKVFDNDSNSTSSKPVKIYVGDFDANLVGHWMFENNVMDSSDYSNDGILSGIPDFISGQWEGMALEFNSSQDYVSVLSSPDFSITDFTLAAWVKIPGSIPSGWRTIIEHNRWGNNWFGLWKSANGNKFHFRWTETGNASSDFNSTISADNWYHVAATFDEIGKTATLYLNGNVDTIIQNADIPSPVDAVLRIGLNMDGSEDFNGIIDDVRVYNRALSEIEINEILTITSFGDINKNNMEFIPSDYTVSNHPNPFNPITIINYELPITTDVELSIYDVLGQKVATLVSGNRNTGFHQVEWDASGFSSGVYFYHLQAGQRLEIRKMVLLR